MPGVEDLRTNLEDANPEIAFVVNRERANREGVSTAQIGMLVRTAIFGSEASASSRHLTMTTRCRSAMLGCTARTSTP